MRILIFVLLLLGTSIQAQNVLTCYDYHDFSETDCVGCGLKDSTFSGILLVKNGTIYQPLVKPIKIKTRPNILDMEDGFATRVSIYIDQITTYNTEASVLAFLRSCVAVESITIGDVTTIIHDSISNITFPLDSTIVTEGYGINVTETSPNVYNVAADTTQLVTPYDITLIDTDNQNLTLLDSVNRVFRLQIEDGNTVKFKDDVNDADFDPANEIQGITVTGSTTAVLDLTADASDASITGAGISVISRSGNAITVTSTEVDGNVSNEIQDLSLTGNTLSLSSDASTVDLSPYLDNTDSQTLTLTDSTNRVFTLGITGGNTVKFKDNVNDADFSTTNEIQTLDVTGTTTATFDLSSDASDPTITGAGISTVSVSGNAITVTSTEVDGSISNEIQTLDVTGTSTATLDLSSDASDPSITGAGISTVSVSGNAITITSTEIDGSISNEIQNLTIDSIGRVFTLGISGGNTVKFKDTGTYTVREPLRIVGATNPYIELIQDTYGDIEVSGDPMDATKSTVWNIVDSKVTSQHILNNTVGFDDIRTLAAKSVIGRAGNTVGVAGEIGATSADQVLRVNGANNVIGWGTVAAGGIADGAVTVDKIGADAVTSAKILNGTVGYADIQNVAATKLLGNSTGSPAAMQEITLGTNLSFTGTILNATGGGGGGTVTSVAATNGTGISISGSPITTSGTLTITNTAPDQTVGITGAGITNVTGTYPNFTVTSTEVGDISSVTVSAPITGGSTSGVANIALDTTSSSGAATQYDLTLKQDLLNGVAPRIPYFTSPTTLGTNPNFWWDNTYNEMVIKDRLFGSSATGQLYVGYLAGDAATSAFHSNFLSDGAGSQATNSKHSNFFGYRAGRFATNAPYSFFVGDSTGMSATNAKHSIFLGYRSGYGATNAKYSTFLGDSTGYIASNAEHSFFAGLRAGNSVVNGYNSIFIGRDAGNTATNSFSSVFIGDKAGQGAGDTYESIFAGKQSGYTSSGNDNSIFIGAYSGWNSSNSPYSNWLGHNAGYGAASSPYSNFFGDGAGSSQAEHSNFFGNGAGNGSYSSNSNFLGYRSGYGQFDSDYSTFIGRSTGEHSLGRALKMNNIIIGTGITLPDSSENSMTLGNVLYGTGFKFNLYSPDSSQYVSPLGKIGVLTSSPTQQLHVAGNLRVEGAVYDSNNEPGTSGQVLSTTVTGTDWVDMAGGDTTQYLNPYVMGPDTVGFYLTIAQDTVLFVATADTTAGTVDIVTGTSPIIITGDATHTPNVTIQNATTSQSGALTSTDWNTFNGKVGGSGTTNYLPKFTAGSTLGNSQIFDNGTNVGIGTSSPSAILHTISNSAAIFQRNNFNPTVEFRNGTGSGTGLQFTDGASPASKYLWYNTGTWNFGGSGAAVTNKTMHIDGGVTIGNAYSSTAVNANSLYVQGSFKLNTRTGTAVTGAAFTSDGTLCEGGIAGSGAAGQIAYFNGVNSIVSSSNLTWTDGTQMTVRTNTGTPLVLRRNNTNGTAAITTVSDNFVSHLATWYATPADIDLSFTPTTSAGLQVPAVYMVASTGNVGIGNLTSPQRKLDVNGEVRIRDLTTDTPTKIVGADADGDLAAITKGYGLSFATDTLKADTTSANGLATQYDLTQVSGGSSKVIDILGSDFTTSATSLQSTALAYTFPSTGTYEIKVYGSYTCSNTANGINVGFIDSGGLVASYVTGKHSAFTNNTSSGTTETRKPISAIGTMLSTASVFAASTAYTVISEALITVSTVGTITLGFASGSGSYSATLQAGSSLIIEKLN